MTPQAALVELLERAGSGRGAAALVSELELAQWPDAAVSAMKAQGLLTKARPASSAVCPGCERECVMPVHTPPSSSRAPAAFIVCDKRGDINRVAVPFSCLEQWQTSGASIANLLAGLLGLRRPGASGANAQRWEIGVLKGVRHSSHLVLKADGRLTIGLAGHSIDLAEVLALKDYHLVVDRRILDRLVDHPVAGAGDAESAARRRERLKKRVQQEKERGTKAFLKVVAEEEGVSISRLKQLLREPPETDLS